MSRCGAAHLATTGNRELVALCCFARSTAKHQAKQIVLRTIVNTKQAASVAELGSITVLFRLGTMKARYYKTAIKELLTLGAWERGMSIMERGLRLEASSPEF